jgi:ankyrin repeat protein
MPLETLPNEVLCIVGTFCDTKRLKSLARVSHLFHDIYNPLLYKHNALYDNPSKASVLWAAKKGSLKTLQLAVENGADINCLGAPSEDFVWKKAVFDLRLKKKYAAPLHLAVLHNREDIVRWLLENGARLDIPSAGLCKCDYTKPFVEYANAPWFPIHYAISHQPKQSMLSLLLKHGAMFAAKDLSAIASAVQNLAEPAIDTILKQDDFDPNYRDKEGATPFHMIPVDDPEKAARVIEKLVNRGVPINAKADEGTVLNSMLRACNYEHALLLLEAGADGSDEVNGHGNGLGVIDRIFSEEYQDAIREMDNGGAFDVAETLVEDRQDVLKLAIQQGADVNRLLGRGNPPLSRPLWWALLVTEDVECVRIMLNAGARIEDAFVDNQPDTEGLLRAFFKKETGYICYSRHCDGDPDIVDFEPFEKSLKLLLKRGARIDAPDQRRISALDEICNRGSKGRRPTFELEFMVEHATSRNASAEYVEGLMKRKKGEKDIHSLLKQLYSKLLSGNEEEEEEEEEDDDDEDGRTDDDSEDDNE